MNKKEEKTWKERYSYCSNIEEQDDLVFAYPDLYYKDPAKVAEELQKAMTFLRKITGRDPTKYFQQKTVIGYRHPNDEGGKNCNPGWLPNWVNIPWKYLGERNEPQDACSHELVHPFFRCSPLHDINEYWGEGFCDFLRGPLKNYFQLNGNEWWRKKITQATDNQQDRGGNAAGQLVLRAYEENDIFNGREQFLEEFINDQGGIKRFVSWLFERYEYVPMSEEFHPTKWITENEKKYGKGPF